MSVTPWTDAELDRALTDLAAVLDALPAEGDTDAGDADASRRTAPEDVVVIGRPAPERRRRRLAPALLVAAAVVVAVVLAAVLWPRAGADRTGPAATPTPAAPADVVAARQALLPVPALHDGSSVALAISGVGDATISFPTSEAVARAHTIAYGFVCGDPRYDGDPNGPDNSVSEYSVLDNLGRGPTGSCVPVGSGIDVAGFAVGQPVDPAGRSSVRVDVPAEDVVWKLTLLVH